MDYYHKYLKYKQKYLQIQCKTKQHQKYNADINILGGGSCSTSYSELLEFLTDVDISATEKKNCINKLALDDNIDIITLFTKIIPSKYSAAATMFSRNYSVIGQLATDINNIDIILMLLNYVPISSISNEVFDQKNLLSILFEFAFTSKSTLYQRQNYIKVIEKLINDGMSLFNMDNVRLMSFHYLLLTKDFEDDWNDVIHHIKTFIINYINKNKNSFSKVNQELANVCLMSINISNGKTVPIVSNNDDTNTGEYIGTDYYYIWFYIIANNNYNFQMVNELKPHMKFLEQIIIKYNLYKLDESKNATEPLWLYNITQMKNYACKLAKMMKNDIIPYGVAKDTGRLVANRFPVYEYNGKYWIKKLDIGRYIGAKHMEKSTTSIDVPKKILIPTSKNFDPDNFKLTLDTNINNPNTGRNAVDIICNELNVLSEYIVSTRGIKDDDSLTVSVYGIFDNPGLNIVVSTETQRSILIDTELKKNFWDDDYFKTNFMILKKIFKAIHFNRTSYTFDVGAKNCDV